MKKIANRDQENDRGRRMNIRRRRREGFPPWFSIGETLDYENVPTPTSKVLFSFSYVPLFSLPRPSHHRCRPRTHPFLPLVISVLSRARVLLSSYTYARRLSDRSSSRFLEYGFRDGGIGFVRHPGLA